MKATPASRRSKGMRTGSIPWACVFALFVNAQSTLAEVRPNSPKQAKLSVLVGSISSSQLYDSALYMGMSLKTSTTNVPLVAEVKTGGPAYAAGICRDDRICSIQKAGDSFKVTIERAGKKYCATVQNIYARTAANDAATTALSAKTQFDNGRLLNSAGDKNNALSNQPFLASQIAREGADGVEQASYPDCWLEATIAALASVPKGQELIAESIVRKDGDNYAVSLRGSSQQLVSSSECAGRRLGNASLWASLLESACMQKCNVGAVGNATFVKPAIQTGMEMLTGEQVNCVRPDAMEPGQLGGLLYRLATDHIPVTFSTKSSAENNLPPVITQNHAFSLIGYESNTQTVTIRNVYGNEQNFPAASSAGVTILGRGRITMPVSQLAAYIRFIAYPREF